MVDGHFPSDAGERWMHDVNLARQVQVVLQGVGRLQLPGLDLVGASLPARSMGGDYYDFLEHGSRVRVVMADVMGKGVGAAMQMAMTRAAIRSLSAGCTAPAELLRRVNDALYPDLRRLHSFITMVCADYDRETGMLTCANSGHPSPLLVRGREPEIIEVRGTALGILPAPEYGQVSFPLAAGTVIFFTDGAVDATDAAGRQLRLGGLIEMARAHPGYDVHDLRRFLLSQVLRFSGDLPQRDDITIAMLHVAPRPAEANP